MPDEAKELQSWLAQHQSSSLEGPAYRRVVAAQLLADLGQRQTTDVQPDGLVDLQPAQANSTQLDAGSAQVSPDAMTMDAVLPSQGVHVSPGSVVGNQLCHWFGGQSGLPLARYSGRLSKID